MLTSEEESELAQYVADTSDMGFGLTKEDVMRTALPSLLSLGGCTLFGMGQQGIRGSMHLDLNIPTSPYIEPSLFLLLMLLLLQTKKQ